jgi:hypothetical protein
MLVFEFGEPLKLAQTAYNDKQTANGLEVRIDARNLKELRTQLGRVKALIPTFDIQQHVTSRLDRLLATAKARQAQAEDRSLHGQGFRRR